MVVRRDFWEGKNKDEQFFPASETNPLLVSYLHPEENEVWIQTFVDFDHNLLSFVNTLETHQVKFNVFGVWTGKGRSDAFPLNKEIVKELCVNNTK